MTDNTMTKRKRTKGQIMIYRKLKIEQHEHHLKPVVSTGAPEGLALRLSSCKQLRVYT
jgi:hypothetical protein